MHDLRRLLLLLSFCAALPASAELRLPDVLSSHAVLQRDRPIHIWGWSTPGASIHVAFHDQTATAVADTLGKWSAYLQPEHAGGPYDLKITGDGGSVSVDDLLVGDVWIASGQSNMEIPLDGFPGQAVIKDAAKEIASANLPQVRLLLIKHTSSDFPVNDIHQTWTTCTPETARSFSAVGFFFAREISAREHVPVGVIDTTWGGTPADSWVSMNTLGTRADLLPAFASRASFADEQADMQATRDAEKAEDAQAAAAGRPKPNHPWHPDPESWKPAALYNGMIAPLTPLEVRGFLWYQGESNSGPSRAPYYHSLMSALIGDWRTHFAQGNLPFLFVQISSFDSPGEQWGEVRDQQRRTLDVANTGMAVSLDVGLAHNVHPPDKQTVAARLALAARSMVYGETVPYSGPLFRQATPQHDENGTTSLRIWFDHAHSLKFEDGGERGFELAGADHHFVPATARIDGPTVVVSAPSVPQPRYARYGWQGVVPGSLRNEANLPASTFTSEP